MYISQNWLAKYLPQIKSIPQEKIADSLTASLAEVEETIPVRHELKKIVAGEVVSVRKHPNSDKLSICEVNIGEGQNSQIICGATNVREGITVPVCLPGGVVYNPEDKTKTINIESRELRGEISNGMICSHRELDIADNHDGIMIIESSLKPGEDLSHLLKDLIFEIENKSISHRSDCFSHLGIARELAAILNLELQTPHWEELSMVPTQKKEFEVDVKATKELCPRFTAIVVDNVQVSSSPLWIQSFLSAVGVRPINNIVDITNYVMMDRGQPLHAYDYDKLSGNKLIIRQAKKGEEAVTLDGKTHKLESSMTVVADDTKVEDIAGIMGGKDSEVGQETTTIVLEAANWEMYSIRRTSRTLGIRTEASTRFEKGQDPEIAISSLKAATTLAIDIAGGEVASDIIDHYPSPATEKLITLSVDLTNRYLGADFSTQEVVEFMSRLGITELKDRTPDTPDPADIQSRSVIFTIPSFRKDLNIQQDLIEEVARLYGYANLTPHIPEKKITPVKQNPISIISRQLITSLANKGFDEVSTYSFIGEKAYTDSQLDIDNCIKIKNPIAPELSHMRNTLLPSFLKLTKENSKTYDNFNIFEICRIVDRKITTDEELPYQPWQLSGLLYQKNSIEISFLDVKGLVELIAKELNLEIRYESLKNSKHLARNILHPNLSASLLLGGNEIGILGKIHPQVSLNWGISDQILLFEINIEKILETGLPQKRYSPLSQFQASTRDLSFWIDTNISYAIIESTVLGLENQLIRDVELKDIYQEKENDSKKSVTLRIVLQSNSKTLEEGDIEPLITQIVSSIETKLKAKHRS